MSECVCVCVHVCVHVCVCVFRNRNVIDVARTFGV